MALFFGNNQFVAIGGINSLLLQPALMAQRGLKELSSRPVEITCIWKWDVCCVGYSMQLKQNALPQLTASIGHLGH